MSDSTRGLGSFRLRDLGVAARVGVACAVLVVLGGLVASAGHVADHHGPKDDVKGLSLDDVMGAYHGVKAPPLLASALERGHPDDLPEKVRGALLDWVLGPADATGTRAGPRQLAENYDNFDLGDMAPNELIAKHCLSCHSAKVADTHPIAKTYPLDRRDDVLRLSVAKNLTPVPTEILVTSTHTHALSLGTLAVATIALGLATSWPRRLMGALALGIGLGLLADLGGQWIAHTWDYASTKDSLGRAGVYMVFAGGGLYGLASAAALLLVLVDLCLPSRRPS
ncbi:MAG: hypothetical protein IT433_13025 [Phycisphaerales bacterium]|nr:hypothetical protein [Phycisphaerales bacterium]